MDERLARLGTDLALDYTFGGGFFEDADLVTVQRHTDPGRPNDLVLHGGVEAITQAIANRLKTRKGELAALGHPDYGSRHHELMGEPNTERVRNLVKLFVLQALRDEPRIEKVLNATVRPDHDPPRSVVRIELTVRLITGPEPLNLVVPFSLEGSP